MQEQNVKENEQDTEIKTRVLRVLSGPHMGAEINLQNGKTLSLGKGEQCDIVLVDEALEDQHVKFFEKDGEVLCSPEEGAKVFVEGIAIGKDYKLKDFQPIVCGATLLSVGPIDVVWPTIEVPKNKEVVKEDKPANAEEVKKAEVEVKKVPGKKSLFLQLRKWKLVLVGLATIVVIFLFSFKARSLKEEEREPSTKFPIVALRKSIEDVLEKNGVDMNHVKILLSGQKFILHCYVKTSQQKVELKKQLKGLTKVVFQSIKIFVQSILVEQAQSLVNSLQTLVVIPGSELDTVVLKGYLYSVDSLPSIKNRILSDVSGINGISTNLLSPDEVYDLASNLLTQYNLMGLLKIQPVKNGLIVMGNIQASDEPQWKDAQKALKNNFHGICKVLSYVAVVAPQAVKKLFFPSPITTVSIPENEKPWIDLKNGDRYFEGTMLPSSYKIEAITTEGIRIQKNEDVVFFTLAEL